VVFTAAAGNASTGGTVLNAGTLIAANTSGSATGPGTVTVNAGAVLGGTDTVAGGAFNPANFAVTANFPLAALSVTSPTTQTVVVNFTPAPEPTGLLFVAAAAGGAAHAWRKRRRGCGGR
jgi:hypothetical protein